MQSKIIKNFNLWLLKLATLKFYILQHFAFFNPRPVSHHSFGEHFTAADYESDKLFRDVHDESGKRKACKLCGTEVTEHFTDHLATYHQMGWLWKCPDCPAACSTVAIVTKHFEISHGQDRVLPFNFHKFFQPPDRIPDVFIITGRNNEVAALCFLLREILKFNVASQIFYHSPQHSTATDYASIFESLNSLLTDINLTSVAHEAQLRRMQGEIAVIAQQNLNTLTRNQMYHGAFPNPYLIYRFLGESKLYLNMTS